MDIELDNPEVGFVEESHVRPFKCLDCSKRFTRRENLKRHARSVHRSANTKVLQCLFCDVSFSRNDLRQRHIQKHHPFPELQPCESTSGHVSLDFVTDNACFDKSPTQPYDSAILQEPISWMLIPQYVATYFGNFHSILPMLHEATFEISSAQIPLLQAVACLGAVYDSPENDYATSKSFFKSAYDFLNAYVDYDKRRFEELWVSQSFLLLAHFAIYSCNDGLFLFAQKIIRRLVDGARSTSILQQTSRHDHKDVAQRCVEKEWKDFIAAESKIRFIYSLYYMDCQVAVCCNFKPNLSAMEIKYELPCRDHFWSASASQHWDTLRQEEFSSFSEEDDTNGNSEPRPGQGHLYESMRHLIHPEQRGMQLKILWYSPFAALILIMQIQMMAREMITASVFLYSNISNERGRHNLTMITEEHRGPILQALMNLADIIPKRSSINTSQPKYSTNESLWHSVWIAWHYTALCLTHQDALLTTGIVECNIPAAISTQWELGKPRCKDHRDIYDDQDVFRIVENLVAVLQELNTPPTSPEQCLEDPFTTIIGFKTFMIGWRVVRLMMLNISQNKDSRRLYHAGLYEAPTQSVLMRIMTAIQQVGLQNEETNNDITENNDEEKSFELQYLEWGDRRFRCRGVWPIGGWMAAVLEEGTNA